MPNATLEAVPSKELFSPTSTASAESELVLKVSRSRADLVRGSAYVDMVAVYRKSGQFDVHHIHDWVDLLEGLRVAVEGDPADVVGVGIAWSSPIVLLGEGEVGEFRIEAKPRRTRMRIVDGLGKQMLSPWRTASGRLLGGGPRVEVRIVAQPCEPRAGQWVQTEATGPRARCLDLVILGE